MATNRPCVVFFATDWGPKFGGINSFNQDLCFAVARVLPSHRVLCVVPNADAGQVTHAQTHNVELVALPPSAVQMPLEASRTLEVISQLGSTIECVSWWIGHDVVTGPLAISVAAVARRGKAAVIHHMDFRAYAFTKRDEDGGRARIDNQQAALEAADHVFAVGPKLLASAKDKLRARPRTPVTSLVPGLPTIEPVLMGSSFSAITFGRVGPNTDIIKQVRLAATAFGRMIAKSPAHSMDHASLTIIGLDPADQSEERQTLIDIVETEAQRVVPVYSWSYFNDRLALFEELRKHNVCLMLSLHEGFGLTGWEAIAAAVPLIVSRNSGVYEYVAETFEGFGAGLLRDVDIRGRTKANRPFQDRDVEVVSDALVWVNKHRERAKNDARSLRTLVGRFCTWEHTATTFAESLGLIETAALARLNVQRWDPEVLLKALTTSQDLVDGYARRKRQFDELWDRMKPPSSITSRLVLFGGVATALCDEQAARKYAGWLLANPSALLFICYESGKAAEERAVRLDPDSIAADSRNVLSSTALERMQQKEARVLHLPALIREAAGPQANTILSRVLLLPLEEPLTVYIMITDHDVHLTPLFDLRSSETMSFTLSAAASSFHADVYRYILHYFDRARVRDAAQPLINTLSRSTTVPRDDHAE